MKFLHLSVHFEFSEIIEKILDEGGVKAYSRYPMIEGKDGDGKHMGSQVYPGSITVYHALLQDGQVEGVFDALEKFRKEKKSHMHLYAAVQPVEQSIGLDGNEKNGTLQEKKPD